MPIGHETLRAVPSAGLHGNDNEFTVKVASLISGAIGNGQAVVEKGQPAYRATSQSYESNGVRGFSVLVV